MFRFKICFSISIFYLKLQDFKIFFINKKFILILENILYPEKYFSQQIERASKGSIEENYLVYSVESNCEARYIVPCSRCDILTASENPYDLKADFMYMYMYIPTPTYE